VFYDNLTFGLLIWTDQKVPRYVPAIPFVLSMIGGWRRSNSRYPGECEALGCGIVRNHFACFAEDESDEDRTDKFFFLRSAEEI
jgi:hypothetical protein